MNISQAIFNGNSIFDLTNDTVIPEVVLNGYTFHSANGDSLIGIAEIGSSVDWSKSYIIKDPNGDFTGMGSLAHQFDNIYSFNSEVEIGENVINTVSTFENTNFNYPINIPNNVINASNMFKNSNNFNQNIILPENINDISGIFEHTSFNYYITIPNNVKNISNMFKDCQSFNQNIILSDNVSDITGMFENTNYNYLLEIPNNVINTSNLFKGCQSFNQNVLISENVINAAGMFENTQYNYLTNFSDNIINVSNIFKNCSFFNQNIIFTNNIEDASGMFENTQYNYLPILTNNIINVSNMFKDCQFFNQNIRLTNNIIDASGIFRNCQNFNQPYYINLFASNMSLGEYDPQLYKLYNTAYAFENCINLVATPLQNLFYFNMTNKNIINISHMFANCKNLFINSNNTLRLYNSCDNILDASYLFADIDSLYRVVGNSSLTKCFKDVINLSGMFRNCYNWDMYDKNSGNQFEVPLKQWFNNMWQVQDMSYMFANCYKFTTGAYGPTVYDLPPSVINISHMYDGCKGVYLYFNTIRPSALNDMSFAFANLNNGKGSTISFSGGIFSSLVTALQQGALPNISNLSGLFYNYNSTSGSVYANVRLDLCTFQNNIDLSYMFANINNVLFNQTNFYFPKNVNNTSFMFYKAGYANYGNNVVNIFLNNTHNKLIDTSYMFANCGGYGGNNIGYWFNQQRGLILPTSIENASGMFINCQANNLIQIFGSLNNLKDASYMFYNCQNGASATYWRDVRIISNSQEYYWPPNLVNAAHIFEKVAYLDPYLYNNFFNISDNIIDGSYMFANIALNTTNIRYYTHNYHINENSNLINTAYMFYNSYLANTSTVIIPNKVINCANMFGSCPLFNIPVIIPNSVINCSGLFFNCTNFNQPVTLPDSVEDCSWLVTYTSYDLENNPISFPPNVKKISGFYASRQNFNQFIVLPETVEECRSLFSGCSNFNQLITLPNNVVDCSYMFYYCSNFNQPIIIPNNVENCYGMFHGCSNFNQPIIIPNNVVDCFRMFCYCYNFNQPIIIPNNVKYCYGMFYDCNHFDQPNFIIPKNVTNISYMFCNCFNNYSLNSINIYIKSNKFTNFYNTRGFICQKNNYRRVNIYIQNDMNIYFNNTTVSGSILEEAISWASNSQNNCYYNASRNIYIYNYIPEDI